MPRAICRDAGKCPPSAAIPRPFLATPAAKGWGLGRGLAAAGANVILLHYDAPPPWRGRASLAADFAVAAAAFGFPAVGAGGLSDRCDRRLGTVGGAVSAKLRAKS